jgi:hypothetical protein
VPSTDLACNNGVGAIVQLPHLSGQMTRHLRSCAGAFEPQAEQMQGPLLKPSLALSLVVVLTCSFYRLEGLGACLPQQSWR